MSAEESADQMRATIDALEAELISCQRLALLGSLSAMAAHEFNNLMTPVIARAEAALTMGDDVAFMRKSLDRTLTNAQRAVELTRRLMNLAHADERPTETCLLAEIVDEAIATSARPFEKDGIDLQVAVPNELRVRARPDWLCQLLLNLLLNARNAMKTTGGVLSISAMANGDEVRVDVRDSGRGIPPDEIENVFNTFLRADPRERPQDWQAVGLGLNVCRMIAHHHGARIEALANDGPGCTFRLHWPAAGE